MQTIDLEAYRCPTVFRVVRQKLQDAQKAGEALLIFTIEPSIMRDLQTYIASEGFKVDLEQETRTVTEEMKEKWSDNFDEEDYLGIHQQIAVLISPNPT